MRRPVLILSVWAFLVSLQIFAQENRAVLLGTVSDISGGRIPGVEVEVINEDTGISLKSVTNDTGYYEVPFLLPGRYRLEAEFPGFRRYIRTGIVLVTNQRATLDFSLEVGEVTNSLTVSQNVPLLETSTASAGQVIDSRRLEDLPLQHLNSFNSVALVSGVMNAQGTFAPRPWERNQHAPTVAGAGWNNNEYSTDGFTDSYAGNRAAFVPIAPIVQEMKVETSSFDASSGGHMGGFVSAATKSGTNKLHGRLYEMHMQDRWNANNWFSNRENQKMGSGRTNNFGAAVGGPVYIPGLYDGTNRTFFFFNYSGIYQRTTRPTYYRMPTAKERQGDFSELLARGGADYTIYDPATARVVNGKVTRTPFAGNVIPASRLSPIALQYMDFFPLPNLPGNADFSNNYYASNQPLESDYYSLFLRIDHRISERQQIFVRWNDSDFIYDNEDWTGRGLQNSANTKSNPGLVIDDVYTINPTNVLNFKVGWGMNQDGHEPSTMGIDPTDLGFPSYLAQRAGGYLHLPSVTFSSLPKIDKTYDDTKYHVYSAQTSFTRIQGKHSMRTGFEVRRYQFNTVRPGKAAGSFSFTNAYTKRDESVSAKSSGLDLASFLLGLPSSGSIDRSPGYSAQDNWYGVYFQDDWRVSSRLTLNLGLRYELATPTTERYNQITRDFDFSAPSPIAASAAAAYATKPLAELPASEFKVMGGPVFAGVNGVPRGMFNADKDNLMPRAGAAYKVTDNLVLRGGYAIYYNTGIGSQSTEGSHYGFSQSTPLTPTLDKGLTFLGTLADPFPAVFDGARFLEPVGSARGLMTQVGQGYGFLDPDRKAPYQHRWRLGFEYAFAGDWVTEVAYVGAASRDLWINRTLSALPEKYWATGNARNDSVDLALNAKVPNPFAGLVPQSTTFNASTIEKHRLLRPYPHMNGLTQNNLPLGKGDFKSLEARVERRFADGWSFSGAFTKQRDMKETTLLNEFDTVPIREMGGEDRDMRLVLNGMYELPFGRGRMLGGNIPGWMNHIVGDWLISGIYQAQGGVPLTFGKLFFNGDYSAIYLPEDQRTVDRWFNTAAGFVTATADQPSNYHVRTNPNRLDNRLRSDGTNQCDLSVVKNVRLGEEMAVKFKLDMINAFNHPMFGTPNTDPKSTNFGKISSQTGPGALAGTSRMLQFNLQFIF